jgi:hypothetical protein
MSLTGLIFCGSRKYYKDGHRRIGLNRYQSLPQMGLNNTNREAMPIRIQPSLYTWSSCIYICTVLDSWYAGRCSKIDVDFRYHGSRNRPDQYTLRKSFLAPPPSRNKLRAVVLYVYRQSIVATGIII